MISQKLEQHSSPTAASSVCLLINIKYHLYRCCSISVDELNIFAMRLICIERNQFCRRNASWFIKCTKHHQSTKQCLLLNEVWVYLILSVVFRNRCHHFVSLSLFIGSTGANQCIFFCKLSLENLLC